MKNEVERSFEDDKKFQDTIASMETSLNNVTETDLIQTILKDEKVEFPDDNSHLAFPQMPEEMKKIMRRKFKKKLITHQLKINRRDFEKIKKHFK